MGQGRAGVRGALPVADRQLNTAPPGRADTSLLCNAAAAPDHERPMPEPDEVLFERYRSRGDARALGELFDRTAPSLLRIALHLARDPAAAEDLLQR